MVSATEIISEGAEGIILESVLEGYAEYFSADLSEKVVRGMTENAMKCVFNGGTIPMGYIIDQKQHFQPDPLTAPMVLEAFKRYDEGATMKAVRDWLNLHGMKNTKGRPLNYNSVEYMLKNADTLASTNIAKLSFQTVFLPLFPRICLTVYKPGWKRTGALLPGTRQRMITC